MDIRQDRGSPPTTETSSRTSSGGLARLTPRERQIIRLVSYGETSKAIGLKLGISFRTVEVHRAHILAKLGIRSLAELILLSINEWPELARGDGPEFAEVTDGRSHRNGPVARPASRGKVMAVGNDRPRAMVKGSAELTH